MRQDLDTYFKEQERHIKEAFGMVIVTDGFGKKVASYNAIDLGVQWFNTSNDYFFNMYDFNWVPRGHVYELARRKAGKI